jgi:hypothetical protein
MLINFLLTFSYIQYSIYLAVKSRFCSNLRISKEIVCQPEQYWIYWTRSVPDPQRNWETNAKVVFAELLEKTDAK